MIVREMAVNWVGRLLSGIVLLLGASLCDASPTSVIYYHTDALGSVVAVTNEAGEVIERREYEPYGLRIGGDSSDGPGYTGHVHDRETGLDYMQQRYYDPAIGVFLSVDPVAVDARRGALFNRYAYANNNPYKFTDPDGRMFWL
ncbi:MAG: RHS repeat-associated core domain-containing protein, partial [Stenotrophomonas sp.]